MLKTAPESLGCKASQRRDRGPPCPDPSFDEAAVYVRRPPRTETTGAPPAPLADASAHASQSSAADAQLFEAAAAAAQLIKTAKDEQQTMANRWDSGASRCTLSAGDHLIGFYSQQPWRTPTSRSTASPSFPQSSPKATRTVPQPVRAHLPSHEAAIRRRAHTGSFQAPPRLILPSPGLDPWSTSTFAIL